ncbi:conserved hypothetical protein [Candidatus Terasakiella magnetica]|uniref:Uncharacterized protein n=1 Tax=Candidatus Terasakiella magnetica TaxID=1867952 RepID=A0A1C3RE20_9PROT|nr:conserved hypothetical protein [Candidatus Terasakiella magnetica]
MQRPGITRERLVGLCLFGVLLFSPSIISIFDRGGETMWFGIPVLLVYLFGAWFGLIVLAALMVIRRQMDAPDPIDLDEEG